MTCCTPTSIFLPQKSSSDRNLAHCVFRSTPLHLAFILIIGLISYRHLLSIYFLSDDFELLQKSLLWIDPGKGFFRPLPRWIMLAVHWIFGPHPFAFHLISFLIHYANALLLYSILQKLTRDKPAALMGSALFICNFLSSEGVFWIAAINSILVTLFILLGIHSFLNFLSSGKTSHKAQSLACLILGLLTNENAVIVPILLFLLMECQAKFRGKPSFALRINSLALHFFAIFIYALIKAAALISNFREQTLSMGYHAIRNLRFMLLSIFTFNPFNDFPWVYLDIKLMNIFIADPLRELRPVFDWTRFYFPLLLGIMIIFFFLFIIIRGPAKLKYALLAVMASTFPVIFLSAAQNPFGGYFRYPLRLFYLPCSLFMIFTALTFHNAQVCFKKRHGHKLFSAALAVLFFSLLVSETMKTNARNSDWQKAGDISRSVLSQFESILNSRPETRHAVLFNMPDNYRGVYIFRNGFAAAVKLFMPAAKVKIEVLKSRPSDAGRIKALGKGHLLLDCSAGELKPVST